MKEDKITDRNLDLELIYWIGENAQDNWDIIDKANPKDIWFHLANEPSAHIILRLPEDIKNIRKQLSKQTLLHCGMVCKQHSKFATAPKKKVVYTEILNISKGDKPGAVFTRKQQYMVV